MAENTEAKETKSKKVEVPAGKENEIVNFKSNGKSKHLDKDEVYEETFEIAAILANKGYGTIID